MIFNKKKNNLYTPILLADTQGCGWKRGFVFVLNISIRETILIHTTNLQSKRKKRV